MKKYLLLMCSFCLFCIKVDAAIYYNESDFANKLNDTQMSSIKNKFKNGNSSSAKNELLTYYKNKFANINTRYNSGTGNTFNYLRLFNAYSFQEYYINHVDINSDDYKLYSINLGTNVTGNYVLTTFKKTTDHISIVSRNITNNDKPKLIITKNNGKQVTLTPSRDTYIRAGSNGGNNYGNEILMYVKHVPNGNIPYSNESMRSYMAFNIPSDFKSDIKSVVLKINAKIQRPSGKKNDSSIPLVVMQAYYTNWAENSLTWNKVFNDNGIGHYSYDGIPGGFDWKKPAGTPSEFINYNRRFTDLGSLSQEGDKLVSQGKTSEAKVYYNKVKELLLDYINDYVDIGIGEGLNSPYRLQAFPAVYKALLKNNILNSEENYRILCWVYHEIDYVYNEKSQSMFSGATDKVVLNKSTNEYLAYYNWGLTHLAGFYSGIAYFNEFKNNSTWKNLFEKRFNVIFNKLIKSDGSYRDVSFGYPFNSIDEIINTIKIMDIFSDTKLSKTLKSKLILLGKYLMYCSYPDGTMPFWGQGWSSTNVKTYLKKIVSGVGSVTGSDLNNLNEINSYINGKLTPKFVKFSNKLIVTDHTGYTKNDSSIFMNAKIGGGHAHRDSLSLLFYYKGRELLRDNGATSYDKAHAHYNFQTIETKSHNTIEINNTGQGNDSSRASSIDISGNKGISTITSWTNATPGFTHYRNVTYAKKLGDILIVSDYVKPSNSSVNTYTQNWHTAVGANSAIANDTYKTGKTNFSSGSNLIIAQANTANLSAKINSGYDYNLSTSTTKYFTYTKKQSGNVYYQTVLYPVESGVNLSNVKVEPISLISNDKSSAIRVNVTDSKNTNKQIYSYTTYTSGITGSIIDKSKNRTITTDSLHMLLSYDNSSNIIGGYINNGSNITINNSKILTSTSKISDLTFTINNNTLSIYTNDTKVINGTVKVTLNINNKTYNKVTINDTNITTDRYAIKNTGVTINEKGTSQKPTPTENLKGDVNSDNKVSALDYILIKKHILKITTLDSKLLARADVNADGKINAMDYIIIRKIILKII